MNKYYKIFWDESRGDEYNDWGTSWWYFEVDSDSQIIRQLELYNNGNLLVYGQDHLEDEYGGLAESRFDEFDEGIDIVEIQLTDFEQVIKESKIINKATN